ncbi:response regulator [Pleomorphovibrio marinus]|uniref:response regulator n=1 Tax=Pleomorphovibrio marinus TaxID=2164132 RepID=UPI000E0B89E6|nr:response regulator [Pleomorphovibrio marinus]
MKEKVKILLVDDDPIVILLQKKLMEKAGLIDELETFSNGEDAIAYLIKNVGNYDDYLLFLDINMPGLTGWDVLDTLGEMDLSASLTVIIITSSIEQAERDKSKEYKEVLDFWVKPFSINDFSQLKNQASLLKFFKDQKEI